MDWRRDALPTGFPTDQLFDIYKVQRLYVYRKSMFNTLTCRTSELLRLIANAGNGFNTANIGCANPAYLTKHDFGRPKYPVVAFKRLTGMHVRVIMFAIGVVVQSHVKEPTSTDFGGKSQSLVSYKTIELGLLDCDVDRFGPTVISALGLSKATIGLAPNRMSEPSGAQVTINTLSIKSAWSPRIPDTPGREFLV